jgi:hypothetical protein
MVRKPENTFSSLINSKLDKNIYYEKMANPFRSGTPDFYYEGLGGILWVEYKWIPFEWQKNKEASKICSTKSWTHQRHWLERAYSNKIPSNVIIGIGLGRQSRGYILNYPFNFNLEKDIVYPIEDLISFIEGTVL